MNGANEIVATMDSLQELREDEFDNFIEVNTCRRSLFFQICRYKVMADNVNANIKALVMDRFMS
jgi:hypothetical protein